MIAKRVLGRPTHYATLNVVSNVNRVKKENRNSNILG